MIIDSLKNSQKAERLHPCFKKVFDYINSHDLLYAEPGHIEIDDNCYINVDEVRGRDKTEALIETHDKYIDIQVLLKGVESYGWTSRKELEQEKEPYHPVKDITFYSDAFRMNFTLQPGEFVIFFPEDGHAPCIGEGEIKKIVAKIRILE